MKVSQLNDAASANLTDKFHAIQGTTDVRLTPAQLFTLLINNGATYGATASQAGILTTTAQSIKGPKTLLDALTINVAHVSGAETCLTVGSDDDATGKFFIENGSAADNAFLAALRWKSAGTSTAGYQVFEGSSDSGSGALGTIIARIGASTAVVNRPLWEWRSGNNAVLQMLPLNSGANSCLSWGMQASGSPTPVTRSLGTRLVLHSLVDASNVDAAIGVRSTGAAMWFSLPSATNGRVFEFYGGTTVAASIRCDGLIQAPTGGFFAQGNISPTTGTGGLLMWNGTRTILNSLDWSGPTYKPIAIDGSSVELRPNGSNGIVVNGTNSSFSTPLVTASATLSTLPSASANTRGIVWVSDMTGGAQHAYSDGANWRRMRDGTVAS